MRIGFGILLLCTPAAHAEVNYCVPTAQVDSQVEYCYQNEFYVQAADLCLQKFQSDILNYQRVITSSFRGHDEASVSAQQRKLDNTAQDLSDTNATLHELLRRAHIARDNVVTYRKTIILPGAATPEELGDAYGIYANTNCYHDNKEALENRIALIDLKIAELSRAKTVTNDMQITTGTRLMNLGAGRNGTAASPAQRFVSSTRAQGAARPAVPHGHSRNEASTITGDIKWGELGNASR